jgi:predicted nuclease of predicted toxin-antitoxin system
MPVTTENRIGPYFDEHIRRVIANGLIQRGYRAIMAVDVGMMGKDDDTEHLPYATQNRLILVTSDKPFAGRATKRTDYLALIYLSKALHDNIGEAIIRLAEFLDLFDETRDAGQVHWLR